MKKYKLITYKTVTGSKDILEIPNKKDGQWVLYKNDEPAFFIDCFDFKEESNLLLNNLILSEKNTIEDVLKKIKKKKKVKLTIETPPLVEIELKSEIKEFDLKPLPKDWLYF